MSTSPAKFALAHQLARQNAQLIDDNELAKILTAFQQFYRNNPTGSLEKTQKLVQLILKQNTFVRSRRTREYYERILAVLKQPTLGTDEEALHTLCWMRRLMKFESNK
ncbi:MAG: hypothetical protein K1Y36_28205 [Blastocatellia bacterium]|nr:hypothetical protein [Blastocatellia bacterium]